MSGTEAWENRLQRSEQDISLLTSNVAALTADVSRLVEDGRELHGLMKQQVGNSHDIQTLRESLGRAFGEIERLKNRAAALETTAKVAAAVSDTRIGIATLLLRYWHVIATLSAASAGAGYLLSWVKP